MRGLRISIRRHGLLIHAGIGIRQLALTRHLRQLEKRELQGLERPGTYNHMVRDLFKQAPDVARKLGLQEPQRVA